MEFAIVDNNLLSAIGLRSIIADANADILVRTFNSFADYVDDTPEMFDLTFVSDRIFLEHVDFFSRLPRAIVLTTNQTRVHNVTTVDVSQSEKQLIRSILQLLNQRHSIFTRKSPAPGTELSPREIEVLALIARGFMNKEIAEALNISLTTVISHRKNIQEKLQTKTVSGLTIYAVLNGFVDIRDI